MVNELSNKYIYDDFKTKVVLTEDELMVLNMLLLKYSIVKIAQKICMSDRNVARIIRTLKDKYKTYKVMEMTKLDIFKS